MKLVVTGTRGIPDAVETHCEELLHVIRHKII